ncbi:MAG: SPFH domain-containing protein [Sedimentisphaerales bacterium]|nr:SPFH domain-containing protein [Sedimentisphaerales bacterium]
MANEKKENIENISARCPDLRRETQGQAQSPNTHPHEESFDFAQDKLDAAGKSLFEALRVSFAILKVIMIVLVFIFLASGFRTVGSDEQALVLRFGKIRGIGEERLLGPGLHWVFPYPIDEIIKIPVQKKVNLPIDSFWYSLTATELLSEGQKVKGRVPEKLNPVKDGYCITRGENQDRLIAGITDSDYNIIHCKWQLTYKIDDPERFFRNVYVNLAAIEAGQNYTDVISKEVTPLLENMVADAVVPAMAYYTIDDIMFEHVARVTQHVTKLLQEKLDRIGSGIQVVSMQLTDRIWPRQVDDAFQRSITASQESQKAISQARTYYDNTLNGAAGPVAEQLYAALHDKAVTEGDKELLWSQLAGAGQEKIDQARAYRTKVVESAKANADYLHRILPEFRKRRELITRDIYAAALEQVLNYADEKFIIQPAEGSAGTEIRISLNRDPTIKPKSEK